MEEIKIGEVWKDIPNYEGYYQISNLGRIKSVARKVKYQNSYRNVKEKLKKTFIGKQGYERVELSKNGKTKKYNVHRIVANVFISNPLNKETVNHINGIKTDNRVENLEWATRSENELHAYKIGLAKNSEKQRNVARLYCKENKIKSIIQLDLDGNFIKEWKSAKEVEEKINISRKNISQCITGKNKTAGGYKWLTKELYEQNCYKLEE